MKSSLSQRFGAYHKEKNTFQSSDRILVALSGGKDSVCLLHLLKEWQGYFGYTLFACHINHKIRQQEAERDLLFCQSLCLELSIPFFFEESDVPSFCSTHGFGIEEGARMERYRLLKKVAKQEGCNRIVTAHSASDQAETVLFRLIRGSGLAGASGIPAKRGMLLRPLLPYFKEEILDFLKDRQILFTEDSSNADIIYSRNRLRNRILPELKAINPSAEQALVRFSQTAGAQQSLVAALCDRLEEKEEISFRKGLCPVVTLEKYTREESGYPVLYEALSRMAESKNISIDFGHFSRLISLLKCPGEGKIIEISSSFAFVVRKGILHFEKYETPSPGIEYKRELVTGENAIPELEEVLQVSHKKAGKILNINKKHLIIHLAFDRIEKGLFVRNFRSGDKIRMYQMTKSVKKLLCDAGIPRNLRKYIPMICDEKEILWLPFFGVCDKARTEEAKEHITLSLSGGRLEEIRAIMEKVD